MHEIEILGVRITAQRYDDAVGSLLRAKAEGAQLRAHFCTVHSLIAATEDEALRDVFASASMVCTDGVPLVWVARRRGAPEAERVCGPDVMLSLCALGRAQGLRHYFLGGRPGTSEGLARKLEQRFPGLVVAGCGSPPFRALSAEEDQFLVDAINSATPDVVWIGLGSPKQDLWAAEHAGRLNASLILPVGAAFDFHSGRLRRAPGWLRRVGLEWLFRLAMEPRRLLRRYVVTNAKFVFLLARDRVGRRGRGP
jgi:N-acetylglucosaminyldiphosphoundecaprenol N-acetyl-beta-D-mannosaminyltransferase